MARWTKQCKTLGIFYFGVFTQPVKISRWMRYGKGRTESVKMEKQVTTRFFCVHRFGLHQTVSPTSPPSQATCISHRKRFLTLRVSPYSFDQACVKNESHRELCTMHTSLLASPSLLIPFSLLHNVFALKFLQVV